MITHNCYLLQFWIEEKKKKQIEDNNYDFWNEQKVLKNSFIVKNCHFLESTKKKKRKKR